MNRCCITFKSKEFFKNHFSDFLKNKIPSIPPVQFSSVAQSCPTLCDPLNHSTPGLPVHHQLPEFTQTHLHWGGDVPKYWSFSFNISLSNEYSRLISFRMDWSDLLAVHGTVKSLLQHHSSKPSILHSAFFIVQPSHPYMTTGKNHSLD